MATEDMLYNVHILQSRVLLTECSTNESWEEGDEACAFAPGSQTGSQGRDLMAIKLARGLPKEPHLHITRSVESAPFSFSSNVSGLRPTYIPSPNGQHQDLPYRKSTTAQASVRVSPVRAPEKRMSATAHESGSRNLYMTVAEELSLVTALENAASWREREKEL